MQSYESNFNPILLIIGSLVLFTILLSFFVILTRAHIKKIRENEEHKRLTQEKHHTELIKNSVDIQERERKRIAADIHDDLIGKLRHIQLVVDDEKVATELRNCIVTARNISHDLSPPLIEETELNTLFQYFLFPLENTYNVSFTANTNPNITLATEIKLTVYRIFQEVITNIEKHAKSKDLIITLRITASTLALLIKDTGIGIKPNQNFGLGLKNIALRATSLNAVYKFKNNNPSGTKFILLCKLP